MDKSQAQEAGLFVGMPLMTLLPSRVVNTPQGPTTVTIKKFKFLVAFFRVPKGFRAPGLRANITRAPGFQRI